MKTIITWKKGTFSSSSQIYAGEKNIGELRNYTFKQSAEGLIRNRKYRFQTKGFFKQETRIIDTLNNKPIGTISYNSMMSKATIQFADHTVYWKYNNGWQTKWSLFDENGTLMKFAGGFNKGTIECEEEDDLLVLTGLFVTNYYQQAFIAIMVAVFIPIWVTLFT